MRAAVLHEYGTPIYGEFSEPTAGGGRAVVKVLAAGVNPLDIGVAAGAFPAMRPPLPSVAGVEGVGLEGGRRVYFSNAVPPFGSMAEFSLVDPQAMFDVPDQIDDASAVAVGISGLAAWLALSWRARLQPGEHVLVLGASGALGMIAVQVARLLGAGRVVAAARSEQGLARAKALGADATVPLDQGDQDVTADIQRAADGRLDIIVDPLWGAPALAALQAATRAGRLIQIGSSAGGELPLDPGFMRGRQLSILGFASSSVPRTARAEAYALMCRHVIDGSLQVATETVPLSDVEEAWRRQKSSPHRKLVLQP
jgi:NADPH:quinone reductase-like Zn-dependent oxidoreductase